MRNIQNYVLVDDKYLGFGYFITTEEDGEIVKFAKFYNSSEYGAPYYGVRAYQAGSIDEDGQVFRDVTISVDSSEELFDIFRELASLLNGTSLFSVDYARQGQNHFTVNCNSDSASLTFSKDVLGVSSPTDFIDISIGEEDYRGKRPSENFYKSLALENFYMGLATVCVRETDENDIRKILMLS